MARRQLQEIPLLGASPWGRTTGNEGRTNPQQVDAPESVPLDAALDRLRRSGPIAVNWARLLLGDQPDALR